MPDKPDANTRIRTAIGNSFIEVEMLRDQVEALADMVTERDAKIAELGAKIAELEKSKETGT